MAGEEPTADVSGRETHKITLTIDGKTVEATEGATILEAALAADIHIPALCNDVRLDRSNGNCGLCMVEPVEDREHPVKACITPVADGMEILTNSDALTSYRRLRLEELLVDHNGDCRAPCELECPAHIDIQRYLALVSDGNYEAAVQIIKDSNPFPSSCGQICPHPCEAQCRRNLVDTPVGINRVKRFAAGWDLNRQTPWEPKVAAPTGKRVAIVGAGPSGLSCAYYLAQAGHAITVFEREPLPGGMMRYGIPEYRLPKANLDAEIATITALGVDIRCEQALGVQIDLRSLKDEYDAVYIAHGSWKASPMRMAGEDLPGVHLGIDFLEKVTKGEHVELGDTVVVIGGGNTAIDCVRTCLRLGVNNVKLLYRRTREQMPAEDEEIEAALAEGIDMIFLTAPDHISEGPDGRKNVHCLKMELGEPDASGRRRPVAVEGSDFVIEADSVIGAIGQATVSDFLDDTLAVTANRWGDIEVDGSTMMTGELGVFAGGDCVTGPATVIQAVGAGARTAKAIAQYLLTGKVTPIAEAFNCSRGTLEDLDRHEFEDRVKIPRTIMPELEVPERIHGFDQVELGLSEEAAKAEAERCLHCGCESRYGCDLRFEANSLGITFTAPKHERPLLRVDDSHPFIVRDPNKCIGCGKCISACGELEGVGVLEYKFANGRLFAGTVGNLPLAETDCVSCGQCVNVCPCGSLEFKKERGQVFRALHDPEKIVVGFVAPAPRVIIAKEFGLPPEKSAPYIAGLMRAVGFDKCFDFSFGADLTIMEEATEFVNRVQNGGVLPQFTSCCPGWVNLVERRHPGLIDHLSSCKSPQQMMGATIKSHLAKYLGVEPERLYTVSIVPCLAKKYEAARPEMEVDGIRDVDDVITTQEFMSMIDMIRLDISGVEPEEFDDPYANVSGAGVIFGGSGGVAEAALRMAAERLTGKVLEDVDYTGLRGVNGFREVIAKLGERTVKVAVVSGLGNVDELAKRIIAGEKVDYDLIEVMACQGGCIGGAGNPVPTEKLELAQREDILLSIDKMSKYRKVQDNPDILQLYADHYGDPNSELAHKLLHTGYAPFQHDLAGAGAGTEAK